MKKFSKDPDVVQAQKDLDEIRMLFGDSEKSSNTAIDILPTLVKDGQNISPEVLQLLMQQSIVPDIINSGN